MDADMNGDMFDKVEEQCFSIKRKDCALEKELEDGEKLPVCCGWAIKINDDWTTIPWCAHAKGMEKFECVYPVQAIDVNLEELAKKFAPKLSSIITTALIKDMNSCLTHLNRFRESKNWDLYWQAYNIIEKRVGDLIETQYGVRVSGPEGLKILEHQDKMVGLDGKPKDRTNIDDMDENDDDSILGKSWKL